MIDLKLKIVRALIANPEWITVLQEVIELDKVNKSNYLGWEWFQLHSTVQRLNAMVAAGLLDIGYLSSKHTFFKLRNPELIIEAIEKLTAPTPEPQMPNDLFKTIVGHNDIKKMVKYAIDSKKPSHLLFQGCPASAKTLFLLELSRLPNAYYALAQTLTSAGLASILFTYTPEYVLIDELNRLNPINLGVLNSLLATGIISETKIGKTRSMVLETKVFAACVTSRKLPGDLLSRFLILQFNPYTESEFIKVCTGILPNEGCSTNVAEFIGGRVWKLYGLEADIRRAVQIARLSGGDKTRISEIMKVLDIGV